MATNNKESVDSGLQQYLDRAEALRLTPAFSDEKDPLHKNVIDEIDRLYGLAYPEGDGADPAAAQEAATPSGPIPPGNTPSDNANPRFGNFKPDRLLKPLWDQAKELKISPPASDSLADIVEFQTRVSKQTEKAFMQTQMGKSRYKPWGI